MTPTGIRLTDEQKETISAMSAEGKSVRDIAAETGIAKSTIQRAAAKMRDKPDKKNAARAAQIYLDQETFEVVERLKIAKGYKDRGKVMRRAIALLDVVLEYKAKGYRIYLRDSKETERELKLVD